LLFVVELFFAAKLFIAVELFFAVGFFFGVELVFGGDRDCWELTDRAVPIIELRQLFWRGHRGLDAGGDRGDSDGRHFGGDVDCRCGR
jgi:hypothetical protein